MKIPLATYRLQFHNGFTFADAEDVIGYLSQLGISDIYASPILKAKPGSQHGYDVVDPTRVNPELGGEEGFERLIRRVRGAGMGWVQDLVPNHMAFDADNRLLMDICEQGTHSPFYHFFDIDWDHPYEELKGKLLVPVLGDLYGECLDNGQIRLAYHENGFCIEYYEWKLPVRMESYAKLLHTNVMALEEKIDRGDAGYLEFMEIVQSVPALGELDDPAQRHSRTALIKSRLWKLYQAAEVIRAHLDGVVETYNGVPGDRQSLNRLDELLGDQIFRLSYWKVANEELNYRRFFTINTLICLHMQRPDVFDHLHGTLLRLAQEDKVTGLRIDHIDGLYDPQGYIQQLRERNPNLYTVAEKILGLHEKLASFMTIEGTTGYDFLSHLNALFVERSHEKQFDRGYGAFTGQTTSFQDILTDAKRLFTGKHMAGDIDNLAHLLKRILNRNRYGKDITMYALRRSIVEMMTHFPVYRTYMSADTRNEDDRIYIKETVSRAVNRNPDYSYELNFIGKALLLDFGKDIPIEEKEEYYHFTKKFQQLSGPLMAKGAEDTSFYIYNRFVSLNEVGGHPDVFGISAEDFHDFIVERGQQWPHAMNATSTHDTKRSEDVRARLNVLSEMPQEWFRHVKLWHRLNRKAKRQVGALKSPSKNDEYLIYQTLIGAYPFDDAEHDAFVTRMKDYIVKAIREAKVHTAWIAPDVDYENACQQFLEAILAPGEDNEFLKAFLPFQKRVAFYGMFNSLSQVTLKLTCAGVPDFYQGSELWDLSVVDPDNRRPVDYDRRKEVLRGVLHNADNGEAYITAMLDTMSDGRVKLYLMHRLLQVRQNFPELFQGGGYRPLDVRGQNARHVLAFARQHGSHWVLVAVPRFLTAVLNEGQLPLGPEVWADTDVVLPADAPTAWSSCLSSQLTPSVGKDPGTLPVAALFQHFPVFCGVAGG